MIGLVFGAGDSFMHILYGQGRSGEEVSFSLRSGNVRESQENLDCWGNIALLQCRSEKKCQFLLSQKYSIYFVHSKLILL